jgi:predicted nucleotidyltransferase
MVKFKLGNTKASRLTPTSVMEIRAKWATSEYTQAQLSREYRVSITTIRNILYGVTWQRLPPVIPQEQISFAAVSSQASLETAKPVEMTDEAKAKLMKELSSIKDGDDESTVDPVQAYLDKAKGGSSGTNNPRDS